MNSITFENPRTGKVVGSMDANRVLDLISTMAWKNADPGILFLDSIKQAQDKFEATSPCGEYPLRANQAICQGSIDISKHVVDGNIDFDMLQETVELAVTFLDNALMLSSPINPQSKPVMEANRCIGLGIMGWADALIMLGLAYDSAEALEKAEEVMQFIHHTAHTQSAKLAGRGECRPGHRLEKITAISPTGTTSLIAECSQGIEPLFALAYTRSTAQFHLQEVHPLLKEMLQKRGILTEKMLQDLFRHGIDVLPKIYSQYSKLLTLSNLQRTLTCRQRSKSIRTQPLVKQSIYHTVQPWVMYVILLSMRTRKV